jgi:catechol 2,3-dioxygenase-like lactoylglutathione lyase family enzyme
LESSTRQDCCSWISAACASCSSATRRPQRGVRNAASATLYFRVDDIEAAFQALQARGVIFEGEPHLIHRDEDGVFDNPGTEEWMVFFKDPGGNTLALAARR